MVEEEKLPTKQNKKDLNYTNGQMNLTIDNNINNATSTDDDDDGNFIILHRAGKDTKISWDKLKYPHARSVSKQFQNSLKEFNNNDNNSTNSGENSCYGSFQNDSHLSNSTDFTDK